MELRSKMAKVNGSKIHYLEGGVGKPMLFLHGMPASSYVWRKILPKLMPHCRCIAPDLIGMGRSGKPDIRYRIQDHIAFIEALIEKLELDQITLVLHGWGSVIGFDYAARHPDKIQAVAFYEGHPKPTMNWERLSLPVQQLISLLSKPHVSRRWILEENYFMEKLLPKLFFKKLKEEEWEEYQRPFKKKGSRQVLWQYILDFPKGAGKPKKVIRLMQAYSKWLRGTKIPKLLMYSMPGFVTPISTVMWCQKNLTNLEIVDIGEALHYAQETNPQPFAKTLKEWYVHINKTK